MKIKTKIIVVVLCIAVVVIAIYTIKHIVNLKKLAKVPAKTPIVVSFAKAKTVTWQQQIHSIGTITALKGVSLRAEVAGRITKIYVPSATLVNQGTPLFQINPKVLQAQVEQDKATLTLSQFRYKRMQELYQKKAVSLQQLVAAKAQLGVEQAKLESTQQQLVLTTTYAPFDGIVGLKKVDVGDYVQAGQILATFQSTTNLRVDFTIPQQYAQQLQKGDEVLVTTQALPHKLFKATVYAFNPLINQGTRTLDVRAHISGKGLMPGMFVNAALLLGKKHPVIVIPQTAVVKSIYGDFVYKVVNGKATKTVVKIGQRRGTIIAITQGLKAEDTVVSVGQVKIHDGARVTNQGAIIVKSQPHAG